MALPSVPAIPDGVKFAPLVMRAVTGVVLAYHGYLKIDRGAGRFADGVHRLEVFGTNLPHSASWPLPEPGARGSSSTS